MHNTLNLEVDGLQKQKTSSYSALGSQEQESEATVGTESRVEDWKDIACFFQSLAVQLNADIYENDPELQKIREEKGYSYMDVIEVHPDKLPNYEDKLKMFYEEHLHLDDEIRYILDGRAYFDVRDKNNRWIRIALTKGDMITLPAGIYHRFTMDETNYTKAMRLFVGEPVWKAYNRPADHFEIRKQYVNSLKCS